MPRLTVGNENNHAIQLHYEDHGTGRPVVLIHGWPLSSRAWEAQVPALLGAGYRVVTYDRRGFGASSQPWNGYDYDTFADDLHALMTHLDLRDAALVGFSMGGGEVARTIAKHGTARVSAAVFAAAVPPCLLKKSDNPEGPLDEATIASFHEAVRGDRPAFLEAFMTNFFSANGKLGVSDAQRRYALAIAMMASPKGTYDCITAWGTTDFRTDLAKVKVPTLVIHGDADAIVPFEVSGKRTAIAIPGAETVVLKNGSHGITASHAKEFNEALLAFLAKKR